jgi:N-acetylglucosamine-6-phosphate deacetylase
VTLISAGTVVWGGRVRRPGWLETSGPRIIACGSGMPARPADAAFHSAVVVPGFVDMHVHGGGGASYADPTRADIVAAATFGLRHGTTTTVASLVTASPAELLTSVAVLGAMSDAPWMAGIHLEGPWLSETRCGAHDRTQLRDPDPAEIDAVLAAGGSAIRMVTLAPERRGAIDAVTRFVDAGVVVALGHTDATYDQTRRALASGAQVGTHLFNGMRPMHHREPGPVLALLEDPRVTVELIADGVHVHPAVVRWVIDTAGCDRVALITDAIAAAGFPDGAYRRGGLDVDVVARVARIRATATLAGGTATMDRLFRGAVEMAGPSSPDTALAAAVQMTSTTPARVLGLPNVGNLGVGFDADLVVLDGELQVSAVMSKGVWQPTSAPIE